MVDLYQKKSLWPLRCNIIFPLPVRCGCTDHPASMPFCNCPVNMVVFILLTLREQHAAALCAPHPVQTAPHNAACACALCGMWVKCRAEVMGSSRKVRSRVQGGVKETPVCFFFHNSASFLQEDVSSVPPSSPLNNPVTAQAVFVFLRLLNLPPAGKRPISPRHWVLASFALCIPARLPEKAFVFVLVRSGVYLYPHMWAACTKLFAAAACRTF